MLSRTFYLDESATAATGSVSVSVTRLDGTVIDAANATGPASNVYTYTFPGRDVVDELIVTWSATVSGDAIVLDQDRIQVVGGFFFSLTEGRAVDPKLADTATFTTDKLIEARVAVEDEAEDICEQAFVPRFRRVTLNGRGTNTLILPDPLIRAIRSVTITPIGGSPVALSGADLLKLGWYETGVLLRVGGWNPSGWWDVGQQNIVVEYEYGADAPPPDVVRASKIRFKSMLLQPRSPIADRADQAQGTGQASPSQWRTGLPEVDAVYARHPRPTPGFG